MQWYNEINLTEVRISWHGKDCSNILLHSSFCNSRQSSILGLSNFRVIIRESLSDLLTSDPRNAVRTYIKHNVEHLFVRFVRCGLVDAYPYTPSPQ
jgi:hypothetical protein